MVETVIIADSKGKNYAFARKIYEYLLEIERRDFPVKLTDVEKVDFKDTEFKLLIKDNIRRRKCFFIHDSNKAPCQWYTELNFVLEAMTFSDPAEITAILPYTRFARQERKDESRVSVNAKALANMVSTYATRGMTVDLHNPAMQSYFNRPFDNLYSFPALIEHFQKNHPSLLEDLVVISPDVGGGKRAEALVKRLAKKGISAELAFAHKSRKNDNEVGKMLILGDVKDKNCLVLDDIIDTGGTIVKAGDALKEKGAKRLYAYGAHGLFTAGTGMFSVYDKVFTSDTIYHEPSDKIEVVSLVPLFGEAIYRTVIGESLSVLFHDKD